MRNYNYTTISVKKETLMALKDVKKYLEVIKNEFISTDDAICWLLEQNKFI